MKYLVIANRKIENATFFENQEDLATELAVSDYDVLIFVFWSWIVPPHILKKYKCYGMHTGPLLEGKGRGGSPIENLQAVGVPVTTLCAFEMDEGIDTGRVVLAIPIDISQPKACIIQLIDILLPLIAQYLTMEPVEIPAVFKRLT